MYSMSGGRLVTAAVPSSDGNARSEIERASPEVGRYQCSFSWPPGALLISVQPQHVTEPGGRQPLVLGRERGAPAADLALVEGEHPGVEKPRGHVRRVGAADAEEVGDPRERLRLRLRRAAAARPDQLLERGLAHVRVVEQP